MPTAIFVKGPLHGVIVDRPDLPDAIEVEADLPATDPPLQGGWPVRRYTYRRLTTGDPRVIRPVGLLLIRAKAEGRITEPVHVYVAEPPAITSP